MNPLKITKADRLRKWLLNLKLKLKTKNIEYNENIFYIIFFRVRYYTKRTKKELISFPISAEAYSMSKVEKCRWITLEEKLI